MAPAGKISGFHREGNDWFCNSSLPSDITVIVDEVNFHLHKFPLISRCGKIATDLGKSRTATHTSSTLALEQFPGGPDTFFSIIKFCYNSRIEFTARNIVTLYCASDYLQMTDDYGENNLLAKSEAFFYKIILHHWKDCILALHSCEKIISLADKLQIIGRCTNALSVMIFTDPTLFGWPMMMYGSLQSPGGSILWNGINTGARIDTKNESDWWFEDVSYLCVELFERLILTMGSKGVKPEIVLHAVIYYCKKYLPGMGRWQGSGPKTGLSGTVASFSMKPANVDQVALLKSVVKLLPEKKGKSFCRFLIGLLRVALILGIDDECRDSFERRIGSQLEFATLDSLLIPSYSESDTLYNSDCLKRMVQYFVSSGPGLALASPSSLIDLETSPESKRLKRVAKLVDDYMAEIASDVNLKPGKIRELAESLPESSRTLHDGLYRALDIYFKSHPYLSDKERESLCTIIDFQKLSLEACTHASQNERLPLRVVLQVLFFEQMQLRTALAGCLNILDAENAPGPSRASQVGQRDGWVTITRENHGLKVDMERMRSRVGELEQEFGKIKEEMKKVVKSHSYLSSSRVVAPKDVPESTGSTPRQSMGQSRPSIRLPWHRKSSSIAG